MNYPAIPHTTVGVDLGDKKHLVCVLDQAGNETKQFAISNDRDSIDELSARYPEARFALEVGTHSPWISSALISDGREVYVGNPRKLLAVYENDRKSDKRDSVLLARIARVDPKLLSPIKHISQQSMEDRLVLSQRDHLVKCRQSLIKSVRSSVKSLGLRIPDCSTACFHRRYRDYLADTVVIETLEPMLQSIEATTRAIAQLDAGIEKLNSEKYQITQVFEQISGVGKITALAFTLAIEDPHRITKTRDVGAYLGMVPRRDQSGETDKALGISKAGNRYVRTLLVQCAKYILGYHGPECDLRDYGLRLINKGGKGARKKAIVAVARKLAVLMLSLWKSGQPYQPVRSAAD